MFRKAVWALTLVPVALACADPTVPTDAGPLAASAAAGMPGVAGAVTGSGHFTFFPPSVPPGLALRKLGFNGVRRADGTVTGEWQIVVGGTILHGNLDCVTILPGGTRARVSGIVEQVKFSPTFIAGTGFALEVVDNGQGTDADPDEMSSLLAFRNSTPAAARAFCEDGVVPEPLELIVMEKGNFQIHSD